MLLNKSDEAKGYKNVITADFLEWNTDMKFDVVVGNPPYLKGRWVDFLKKGVYLSDRFTVIISPDGTKNFSTRSEKLIEFLTENGIQSKTDCTNFFPTVNTGTIVTFNLDKTIPANFLAFQDLTLDGIITSKVINAAGPKLNAILSSKRSAEWIASPRFDSQRDGLIKNFESITKTGPTVTWIAPENTTPIDATEYWLVNRYFGKDKDTLIIEENSVVGIGANILAIKRIPGWSIETFKSVYLSKIFRFVLSVLRNGGFDTSPRHLKQLIEINKSDQELYAHFGLTQEEIDYVEANVK